MKLLDALYELSISKGDAIAFEDEINGGISYKDFEIATGKLYNYLESLRLPKERIIAIRVKRSYRTFIAMVGAIKAAVPYVIIGDTSPDEYVNQVYEECEIVLTLNDEVLDTALKGEYLKGHKSRDMNDLALIIYSTGTSGFFKGSMHEYGAIEKKFNTSSKGRELYPEAAKGIENRCFFIVAGLYAATSIEDLIDVIVYRTKLVIIRSENAENVEYLIEMAKKKNVYTMEATPKSLPEFIKNHADNIKEYYVTYEMFPCKYNPNYNIYNGYGLSEACGSLCFKEIDKDYDIAPAGKPFPEREVKLLNKNNEQTKRNEIGELCFVPEYFRGYIKKMDLYNKAFRDGYFHTGDLGYYNDDDDIVIVGREKDIKETKDGLIIPIFISIEIKKKINDINNCCVIIFDDDKPMVVAYYISENEHSLDEINSKIADKIPAYALPTHAVKLDKFEYFFSGKLNRNLFNKPVNK